MAQLVGKDCARCGVRIGMAVDGTFCAACGSPVHHACVAATPDSPEACATCGTPADRFPTDPPPATAPDSSSPDVAEPGQVRLWGAYFVVAGIVLLVFGPGWVMGNIPVPWVGGLFVAFGVWSLLFPGKALRERVGRAEADGWERPDFRSGARPRADAAPVVCEGTYETPVFALRTRPFPVTGRGRLTVSAEGIKVTGFRVVLSARSLGLLALITLVVVGGVLLSVIYGFARWAVAAGGGLAIWGASRRENVFPSLRASEGDPVSIRIPWPAVERFHVDEATGRIVIEIKRTKPKGNLEFAPEGDAAPVLRALRG